MSTRLANKIALITGAASGIGQAIAESFAKEGAQVILTDRNEPALTAISKQLTDAGHHATAFVADLTDDAHLDDLVHFIFTHYGTLDILVNNAGMLDNFKTVQHTDDALWNRVLAVNLTAPFKLCRAAIELLEKQEKSGVILNVSSVGGLFGARGGAAYATSKHGLIGLTKNIAATHGMIHNVRANVIAPGSVATAIGDTITDPDEIGRLALANAGAATAPSGTTAQIAAVALFLVSDDASFINGEVVVVDGGWTAG